MMIQAVLGNPSHPEYGVATIPFPIPRDQYAHCMELLEALEIGDALKADCKVEEVDSFFSVLKRTEMLTVNVEELNYLAKRLDSFDTGEAAQFQAMAHKLELFELKDLINLTFCCQQATVITDFSDLAAVGRDHYMNLHGGSASVDELNKLDGEETVRRLIENGGGTITPYGVVYDNGMKLKQIYDGRLFPCYYYEPNVITVAVTAKSEPEDTEHITWLFLPMVQEEIDRALLRGGITDPSEIRLSLEDSQLPNEVDVLLDMEYFALLLTSYKECWITQFVNHSVHCVYKIFLIIKILLATAFRTPDEKDSLQLRRFVVFLRPSQSWVNILRQLRLTLDITIVGNLPASKSNFAFDILSILIGNGQP